MTKLHLAMDIPVGVSLLTKGPVHPPYLQRLIFSIREQAHSHRGIAALPSHQVQT
jgi:hypothetical protein